MKTYSSCKGINLIEWAGILAVITIIAALLLPKIIAAKQESEKRREARISTQTNIAETSGYEFPSMGKLWFRPPTDFGNGVYYFHQTGTTNFSAMLSWFIGTHTNLEFVGAVPDVQRANSQIYDPRSDYGVEVGHTVVFRPKP